MDYIGLNYLILKSNKLNYFALDCIGLENSKYYFPLYWIVFFNYFGSYWYCIALDYVIALDYIGLN